MRKQIRLSENLFRQPYLLIDKSANRQIGKSTNRQIDKSANQQIDKLTTLWLNRL